MDPSVTSPRARMATSENLCRIDQRGVSVRLRLFLLAGLTAVTAFFLVRPSAKEAPTKRPRSVGRYRAAGIETSVYAAGRLRLRVSAESLRFVQLRAFGPFRFGFLQSLEAAGVRVKTLPAGEANQQEASPSAVASAISSLLRDTGISTRFAGGAMAVELQDVRILRQDSRGSRNLLAAARCRSSLSADRILCEKGELGLGEEQIFFSKAEYDGHSWKVKAIQAQQ